MKSLVILLSAAALMNAAEFVTGQAARLIVGQNNFTAQDPGASDVLLGGVGGLAYAGNTLFVADANRVSALPQNNRVLVFRNWSASAPKPTDEFRPASGRCPVCVGRADVVLGQPDFSASDPGLKASAMRTPTAVASDGNILVVADTDNNRVLIWNSIPVLNGQAPNVVLGQPDFNTGLANEGKGNTPTNRGFRGPQGVWIQDGRLYVADTHNHRVMIWNRIPASNFAPADIVLGQANFNAFVQPDLTKPQGDPKATSMLNPVAVSSDGRHLFVTDLGYNRILVWNSIPSQNQQPADLAIGQPDLVSSIADNVSNLTADPTCASNGTDPNDSTKLTYPPMCASSLNFPRYALSDGKRLFIADGGNDRVLVYLDIPTNSGAPADVVLGQYLFTQDQISDNANPLKSSASDAMRTPMSLAWDGANLYVADTFNRRVMIFSVGEDLVPVTGIRNAASREIYAVGGVTISGSIQENDSVAVQIGDKGATYTYKVLKADTLPSVVTGLVSLINAGSGDPLVIATPNPATLGVVLTARQGGEGGNAITLTVTVKGPDDKTAALISAAGTNTSGGGDAAKIAPGTIVNINGGGLAVHTVSAPDPANPPLELDGVQVYFDGIKSPLLMVSPNQITAQLPFETIDSQSISAYVRIVWNGNIIVSAARAVTIVPQNPGIFAGEGQDPRPALAYHAGNNKAEGIISIDGAVNAGDTATVKIEDRTYNYTVVAGDSLISIRDSLVALIKSNPDERVDASASYYYSRLRLTAKAPGADGNGIPYSASASTGAQVIMTATTPALCCAATGLVTVDNPATPGELLTIYATGLGLVNPTDAKDGEVTGVPYKGPVSNDPTAFVSSLAGGKTANIINAGLKPGLVGVYEVVLQLNSDQPTNQATQLTIAQDMYVSNVVTIPVVNPNPPAQ